MTCKVAPPYSIAICTAFLACFLSMTIMIHAAPSATATDNTPQIIATENGTSDNSIKLAPFLVRLHLIRHGETEANASNLVLGQGDSPLTPNGVALAALAASSSLIHRNSSPYWRAYCSDLYRAHRTARIVLGLEDVDGNALHRDSPAIDLVVDARLREVAKGAREGFAKSLSYKEAMEVRKRDANGGEVRIPLLETIDDAWERAKGWIDSLIDEAWEDFNSLIDHGNPKPGPDVDAPKIYHVFALSHSALIRIMIYKMVDDQLPIDYAKTNEGSLSIPNLSCTTIDVRPNNFDDSRAIMRKSWTPSLVRLADVSYLGVSDSPSA